MNLENERKREIMMSARHSSPLNCLINHHTCQNLMAGFPEDSTTSCPFRIMTMIQLYIELHTKVEATDV
jgi:hypothetical protein